LSATKSGPYNFQTQHDAFDTVGVDLQFQFLVENETGLEGLSTICGGVGMNVRFKVANVSQHDLGIKSQCELQLPVQFYSNGSLEYDISSRLVDLNMNGFEYNTNMEKNIHSDFTFR